SRRGCCEVARPRAQRATRSCSVIAEFSQHSSRPPCWPRPCLVGLPEGGLLARRPASLLACVLWLGCGAPTLAEQHVSATPAVEALQKGSFADAAGRARDVLEADPGNPQALLVRAIVRYRATQQQLVLDGRTVVIGGMAGGINARYMRAAAEQAERELAAVETDLAEVAEAKGVSLELCLAC